MSVCQPPLGENVIFSAPNLDRGLISLSFATYGCCCPCFSNKIDSNILFLFFKLSSNTEIKIVGLIVFFL